MNTEIKYLLVMLTGITFFALVLFNISYFEPGLDAITGRAYVNATGGQTSTLNIYREMCIWQGYYGNLSRESNVTSTSFNGTFTNVSHLDLFFPRCYISEFYISTLDDINLDQAVPAAPSDIDNFIGAIPFPELSASAIYNETHVFEVRGNNLTLNSVRTNSYEGDYYIGVMKQGSSLIFVGTIGKGRSFNDKEIDYQIFLPSPVGTETAYNFFLDSYDWCEEPVLYPIDPVEANEGDLVTVEPYAVDPTNESLHFNYSYGFNPDGRWQTGYFDEGFYRINVTVCDDYGFCDSGFFNVTIRHVKHCGDNYCEGDETCSTCKKDCCRPSGGGGGGGGGGSGREDSESVIDPSEYNITRPEKEPEKDYDYDAGSETKQKNKSGLIFPKPIDIPKILKKTGITGMAADAGYKITTRDAVHILRNIILFIILLLLAVMAYLYYRDRKKKNLKKSQEDNFFYRP